MNLHRGDHVRTTRFPGVACWWVGFLPHEPLEECDCRWDCDGPARCECWHHLDTDPSTSLIIMVGDDREHEVPTDSLTNLDEDEFCGGCGQIGCGHG